MLCAERRLARQKRLGDMVQSKGGSESDGREDGPFHEKLAECGAQFGRGRGGGICEVEMIKREEGVNARLSERDRFVTALGSIGGIVRAVVRWACVFSRWSVPRGEGRGARVGHGTCVKTEGEGVLIGGELCGERERDGLAPAVRVVEAAENGAAELRAGGGEWAAEADEVGEKRGADGAGLRGGEREREREQEQEQGEGEEGAHGAGVSGGGERAETWRARRRWLMSVGGRGGHRAVAGERGLRWARAGRGWPGRRSGFRFSGPRRAADCPRCPGGGVPCGGGVDRDTYKGAQNCSGRCVRRRTDRRRV